MKIYLNLFLTLTVFCLFNVNGQQKGKVELVTIDAPSLANSIIGEPTKQPLAVYLPPSYSKETLKRYPVVYYLPGYSDTIGDYTRGNINYIPGYIFENSMNSNITQGRLKEVIMVIVNGYNLLQGCFYQNSPVTGNWEDFVVKDVVSYIDAKYRTIPSAGSRAILGNSMGGYGSLHLSMRHPSVFSVGIGECPGLANPVGLMKTSLFSDNNVINKVIALKMGLANLSKEVAHKKYIDTIKYYIRINDWTMMFSLAYGAAFAPNTNVNAPYMDYPFTKYGNNSFQIDSAIFKKYEMGFGNLKKKIELYKDSLLKLKGYAIDYGVNDYFQWICEGSIYYDDILTKAQIPHRLWKNNGGHGNYHKSNTENIELPYCDSILEFDKAHLSNLAEIEKVTYSEQVTEPTIDKVNRTIHLKLKEFSNVKSVIPTIYVSPGSKISPSLGGAIDLSKAYTYTITSEDSKTTTNWTVTAEVSTKMETQKLNKIQVYPNPAKEFFFVKNQNYMLSKIEIIDMLGNVLKSEKVNSTVVKMYKNQIKPGEYIIKAYSIKDCSVDKIIIR